MISCENCPINQCERYESCDDNCDYVEEWLKEHDSKVRADAIDEFVSARWNIEWWMDEVQEQMKEQKHE